MYFDTTLLYGQYWFLFYKCYNFPVFDVIHSLYFRYGGKSIIFIGVAISTLTSFLSPPAARLSPYALMAMRFINGVAQVMVLHNDHFRMCNKFRS